MNKEDKLNKFLEDNCECYSCKHKIIVNSSICGITGKVDSNVPFCNIHGVRCGMDVASLCKKRPYLVIKNKLEEFKEFFNCESEYSIGYLDALHDVAKSFDIKNTRLIDDLVLEYEEI